MARCETEAHANLKKLAVKWAHQENYCAIAVEVRIPRSGFRADVAAYKTVRKREVVGNNGGAKKRVSVADVGTTAVFECKQARSDFLKDSYSGVPTAKRLKELSERRERLEKLLKIHFPSLLRGESLFAEFDTLDADKLEHKTYRRVLREIGVLQRRLYGKTKFETLTRYQCSNLRYLVVEDGIIEPHEMPLGWGVLVHRCGTLALAKRPLWQEVAEHDRLMMLQRIAVAGTRGLNRELGIAAEESDSNSTQ